jgi:elongation factor P--(R)-beta-lysine ligase
MNKANLLLRNKIKRDIQNWFETQGFIEVETPILQISGGNETHLHTFKTQLMKGDGVAQTRYLHTSPEFAMKKLLSQGETKIFTFARCFRNGESTPTHSPEFTMLEWYRVGENYASLKQDCAAILELAAPKYFPAATTLTLSEAFQKYAGFSLEENLTLPKMQAALRHAHIRQADDDDWSDLFTRVLLEKIDPHLTGSIFLDRYPTQEAALAQVCTDDPRFAERFEFYVNGLELVNAFGELTNATLQRERFIADMAKKQRLYGQSDPLDESFLTALATMPPACGAAMGFDRLIMLATGAKHIKEVLWQSVE